MADQGIPTSVGAVSPSQEYSEIAPEEMIAADDTDSDVSDWEAPVDIDLAVVSNFILYIHLYKLPVSVCRSLLPLQLQLSVR